MKRDPIDIFNGDGINVPWAVCDDAMNSLWFEGRTIHGNGKRVADVHHHFMPEVQAAIANMIAAAPDLYVALGIAMKWLEPLQSTTSSGMQETLQREMKLMRAALKKARGQEA